MSPVEFDITAPPPPPVSIEDARIFQSVKSRLFDGREEPLRFGTYRLIRQLGVGGMGEVFLAHDDELDRPVALKLVHVRLSHDRHFADRMRREARALAKLTHPNVVHVYEVGEDQGRVFIAMEYVQGQSLAQWIRDGAPSWRAILDAYLAAGEGLVAAHAAGLIHRDFKPDNVLFGADGRVCVADFGLARVGVGSGESQPDSGPSRATDSGEGPPTLDQRLSATGSVMGTLNYMPLEQMRGGIVDARSDQFAFCVALYEALWGRSPHAVRSAGARDLVLAEDRPAVPKHGAVPRWVWPIVRRGLARDPERRWPDMRSLLDELRAAPGRRRARWSVAALLGLSLAFAGWMALAPGSERCAPDEAALDGVWDNSRRQALRTAFAATGLTIAGETAARVEKSLDTWTSSWTAERARSCAATRIHGTQSEPMLARRTLCLERQRSEVKALVDVFAAADADVVARAAEASGRLPELGACSIAALDAQAEPVVDFAARKRIDAGFESLTHARVALDVGRTDEATELAERAQAAGKSLGHLPLALEARAVLARVALLSGAFKDGIDALHEVVMAAERAALFDLVATTRIALARATTGNFGDDRIQRWILDDAQLALDRVARPDDPRAALLLSARGRIAEQTGDFDDALRTHQNAYALAEGRMDEGQRAQLRIGIGMALHGAGETEAARAELEQSLRTIEAAWGPGATEIARLDFNLAMLATELGEFDVAEWHLDSAIAIDEGTWGPDSLEVARDHFALAHLAFARGEFDPNCGLVDEVRAAYQTWLGPDHDETASAITATALCRYYAGDFRGAIAGYQHALDIHARLRSRNYPEVAMLHANIGDAQLALGQLDASLASHTQALAILDAVVLADDPELAPPLKGQALVWLETGESARALAGLERALAIAAPWPPGELAEIRFGLARALVAVHDSREWQAPGLARAALEGFETAGLERHARAVRDWLAGVAR